MGTSINNNELLILEEKLRKIIKLSEKYSEIENDIDEVILSLKNINSDEEMKLILKKREIIENFRNIKRDSDICLSVILNKMGDLITSREMNLPLDNK